MYSTVQDGRERFHSRISFDSGTVHRVKFIEGVRTLMAIIVIFHHVDLINPRIMRTSNIVWNVDHLSMPKLNGMDGNVKIFVDDGKIQYNEVIEDRHLLSEKGTPYRGKLTLFGMIASIFDITLFCLITGYVISMVAFRCYNYDFEATDHVDKNLILCTTNYPFWVYKFVRLIIRRSLKMMHSLFWVQLITFLLFYYE